MTILLMSADRFHKMSHKTFSRGRGPIVRDIEKLLRMFEETDSSRRRLKILGLLYLWCKSYQGSREGVAEVLEQVTWLVQNCDGLLLQAIKPAVNAQICKKLEDPYRFEPFLPGKKTMGGEPLDLDCDLHHTIFRVNIPTLIQRILNKDTSLTTQRDATQRFASLTFREVLDLYLEHQMHVKTNPQEKYEFETCTKQDRDRHRIYIHNGMFYSDTELKKCYSSPDLQTLYAVDGNFAFYAFPGTIGKDFNHSSFLSGRPVMCAGTLTIINGQLKRIDTSSGHYRPSEEHLGNVVVNLVDYKVNLSDVMVEWKMADGRSAEQNGISFALKHLSRYVPQTNVKMVIGQK
jgi:hypothetical protein